MDLQLKQQEVMFKTAKSSLKSCKNRLNNIEITAHLQTVDNKGSAVLDKRMNDLLSRNPPKPFPTLNQLKKNIEKQNPPPVKLSTGEVVLTKEQKNIIKKEKELKALSSNAIQQLNKLMPAKNYSKNSTFGVQQEGEVLKVIKDYNGKFY